MGDAAKMEHIWADGEGNRGKNGEGAIYRLRRKQWRRANKDNLNADRRGATREKQGKIKIKSKACGGRGPVRPDTQPNGSDACGGRAKGIKHCLTAGTLSAQAHCTESG